MFFIDPESPNFSDWRNSYSKHPQRNLIRFLIERAVQDIFLDALRNNMGDIVYIFMKGQQIEEFIGRMIKYWEELEDYEKCSEIKNLGEELKKLWVDLPVSVEDQQKNIKEWLKDSF